MKLVTNSYSTPVAAQTFVVGVATSVKPGAHVDFHWKTAAPEPKLRDLWNGHEHGVLAQAGYVQFYRSSLDAKRHQLCAEFSRILDKAREAGAEFVDLRCYEPNMSNALPASATFCHRYALKTWLNQNFKVWLEEQAEKAQVAEAAEKAAELARQAEKVAKEATKTRKRSTKAAA